jgi:pimeloyl-ACP methyl ester carboxylesterase
VQSQIESAELNRPPLLLVPGIDGTGRLFYRQVPRLERRFSVTPMRLRDDAASMRQLVHDLHIEVTRIAPDGRPVTLLGESFGGALTLSYALTHPDQVERLVILNSFAHYPQAMLRVGYQLLRATPWPMMHLVRRMNAWRMHSRHTEPEEIRRFLDVMRDATTREGYLSRLRILRGYDIRPQLPELRAPVLYLAADADTLVPAVKQARLMSELTPAGTMRILEGHGHSCLIAPDMDLGAIIDEWIERADR